QPQTPTIQAPTISAIQTTNVTTPTFQVQAALPTAKVVPTSDAMSKALQNASKATGTKGVAGNIPSSMGSRVGGTARAMAMQMNGGKKESEEAVLRGLRFLVKTQNADGSWGKGLKPYMAAMTGFGVLSFLG